MTLVITKISFTDIQRKIHCAIKNTDASLELFTSETCTRWFFEHVQAKLLWARSFFLSLLITIVHSNVKQKATAGTQPDHSTRYQLYLLSPAPSIYLNNI